MAQEAMVSAYFSHLTNNGGKIWVEQFWLQSSCSNQYICCPYFQDSDKRTGKNGTSLNELTYAAIFTNVLSKWVL